MYAVYEYQIHVKLIEFSRLFLFERLLSGIANLHRLAWLT